jgi:hypothetical protein
MSICLRLPQSAPRSNSNRIVHPGKLIEKDLLSKSTASDSRDVEKEAIDPYHVGGCLRRNRRGRFAGVIEGGPCS